MRVNPCKIKLNDENVYFTKNEVGEYIITHRYNRNCVEIYPQDSHFKITHSYWGRGSELSNFFEEIRKYYFDDEERGVW